MTNPVEAIVMMYTNGGSAGEHILAERFARGEINEEEFRQRLGVLQGRS